MNDIQRVSVTAGFIYALEHSAELRNKWKDIAISRKWVDLHALIEKTLGLAQRPTVADIVWMHEFADRHLLPQLEKLHEIDSEIDPGCIVNGRDGFGDGC